MRKPVGVFCGGSEGQDLRGTARGAVESSHWCLLKPLSSGHLRGRERPLIAVARQVKEGLLFDIGQDLIHPSARLISAETHLFIADEPGAPATARQKLMRAFMIQKANPDLLQIIRTLAAPGGFAGGLHRR